jgi:hypothetical protein
MDWPPYQLPLLFACCTGVVNHCMPFPLISWETTFYKLNHRMVCLPPVVESITAKHMRCGESKPSLFYGTTSETHPSRPPWKFQIDFVVFSSVFQSWRMLSIQWSCKSSFSKKKDSMIDQERGQLLWPRYHACFQVLLERHIEFLIDLIPVTLTHLYSLSTVMTISWRTEEAVGWYVIQRLDST